MSGRRSNWPSGRGSIRRTDIVPTKAFLVVDQPAMNRDDRLRARPTIIANPPGDRGFRGLVDSFLVSGGRRPEDLQARLRARYPNAVVRPRVLAGERFEVWYAYREGHWIRSGDDDQT